MREKKVFPSQLSNTISPVCPLNTSRQEASYKTDGLDTVTVWQRQGGSGEAGIAGHTRAAWQAAGGDVDETCRAAWLSAGSDVGMDETCRAAWLAVDGGVGLHEGPRVAWLVVDGVDKTSQMAWQVVDGSVDVIFEDFSAAVLKKRQGF